MRKRTAAASFLMPALTITLALNHPLKRMGSKKQPYKQLQ
jgi:hypothetical protein